MTIRFVVFAIVKNVSILGERMGVRQSLNGRGRRRDADVLVPSRPVPSTADEFAKQYEAMSEPELLETARAYDSLLDPAQDALRAEFARRGLEPPLMDETPSVDYRTLVTARRYRDLSEAIVARSLLESAGIAAFLQNENLARLEWQLSNGIGGVRLQVDASDALAAIALLDQPMPDAIDFSPGDMDQAVEFLQPHCPRCGSTDIAFQGASRGAALTALWLMAVPLPAGPKTWRCNSCEAHWEDTEDDTR